MKIRKTKAKERACFVKQISVRYWCEYEQEFLTKFIEIPKKTRWRFWANFFNYHTYLDCYVSEGYLNIIIKKCPCGHDHEIELDYY